MLPLVWSDFAPPTVTCFVSSVTVRTVLAFRSHRSSTHRFRIAGVLLRQWIVPSQSVFVLILVLVSVPALLFCVTWSATEEVIWDFFIRMYVCICIYINIEALRYALFALLVEYYAACSGNSLPTFRYNLSVPFSWAPKTGPVRFFPETSVSSYRYTVRNIEK